MFWIATQIWILLFSAFFFGIFVGWFARPGENKEMIQEKSAHDMGTLDAD